jgi:hypothetical protein
MTDKTRHASVNVTRVYWEHLGRPIFEKTVDKVEDDALSPYYVSMHHPHQGMVREFLLLSSVGWERVIVLFAIVIIYRLPHYDSWLSFHNPFFPYPVEVPRHSRFVKIMERPTEMPIQ